MYSRSPIPDSHKVKEGSCPTRNSENALAGVRKCYVLGSHGKNDLNARGYAVGSVKCQQRQITTRSALATLFDPVPADCLCFLGAHILSIHPPQKQQPGTNKVPVLSADPSINIASSSVAQITQSLATYSSRQSGFSSEHANIDNRTNHSHIRPSGEVLRTYVVTIHSMIDEPKLLTLNPKTRQLQIGLQSTMMTGITHTRCLRREKLNFA